MDRRQKKTREAIFKAFTELLAKKHFNQITVGEIIERADVGRATFYAHFETKDYLLKELCGELFLRYFKENLKDLIKKRPDLFYEKKPNTLPDAYWINHVAVTFVETIRWWISHKMKESPQTLANYFHTAVYGEKISAPINRKFDEVTK